MNLMDIGTYFVLLTLAIAGVSSMLTSLYLLRELASFERQITRIDSLVDDCQKRMRQRAAGGQ